MPVKRDSDGNIIDTPSDYVKGATGNNAPPTDPPKQGRTGSSENGDSPYNAKTLVAGTAKHDVREQVKKAADKQTRVYRPGLQTDASPTPVVIDPDPHRPQSQSMDDPPVGWLVVIAGPGQGNVVTLGNGSNSIGRDTTERLSLDFGDEMISRSAHATFAYDPNGKKFYIQHGGGTNLTYVNGQPVLAPQELQPNTHIVIGNTTLRFIPLCGEQFDWDTQGAD